MTDEKRRSKAVDPKDYLSSGCTVLNLNCTGDARGAYLAGTMVNFTGDSSSGKTWMALQALAEASISKRFSEHRLIFDNVENGSFMAVRRYFGDALADRLEPPAWTKDGEALMSRSVEEFYYNAYDNLERGPCIYVLDSMDALTSMQERKKFNQMKMAARKGTVTPGEMIDGKAKRNSSGLRQINGLVEKHGSLVFIICQSRDNVGVMFGPPKTRAGGKAIKFYNRLEIWTSVGGKIYRDIMGKKRQIGIYCKTNIEKNHLTGQEGFSAKVPIIRGYGADDVGACIDYLCDEGRWKMAKESQVVNAVDLEKKLNRDRLIAYIEKNNLEKTLRSIVVEVWNEVDEASRPTDRKRRYG